MATIYANPYDMEAKGFYFDDFDEYQKKYAKNKNSYGQPVEEYSFEFIDGDQVEALIWRLLGGDGDSIYFKMEDYFDLVGELPVNPPPEFVIGLEFLVDDQGMSLEDALEKVDQLIITQGDASDYAYMSVDEFGFPDNDYYFDYEKYGRDLHMYDYEDEFKGMSNSKAAEYYIFDVLGYESPFDALGKDKILTYFDYDAYGRDLSMNREIVEVRKDGKDYIVSGFYGLNPRRKRKNTRKKRKNTRRRRRN